MAPCSWTPEESQVESCEHEDNANIHCQPFPESVSEEHEIYTDYDGCHRHHVKHDSYLSGHFSSSTALTAILHLTRRVARGHVGDERSKKRVTEDEFYHPVICPAVNKEMKSPSTFGSRTIELRRSPWGLVAR